MPLRRKPHAVTAFATEEVLQGSVLTGYRDGSGVAAQGMMVPVKSGEMYDQYGVESKRGWLFLGDPDAGPAFVEGGRVVWGARRFAVIGGPLLFEGFGEADNVSVPLEELIGFVLPPVGYRRTYGKTYHRGGGDPAPPRPALPGTYGKTYRNTY